MSQSDPELHPDAQVMGCCENVACRAPAYYSVEDRLTGMRMKVCNRHLKMMAEHPGRRSESWEHSLERLKARDDLRGEADSTVAALRGEAEEVRNRLDDGDDIAEQLEHRADELQSALKRLAESEPEPPECS